MTGELHVHLAVSALFAAALGALCEPSLASGRTQQATDGTPRQPVVMDPMGSPSRGSSLLTDVEIREAIGPHSGAVPGLQYGPDSCRWIGTSTPVHAPNGWHDRIEVGVFDAASPLEASSCREAKGQPVKDLGDGAVYDRAEGQLWFACGRDGFCVVEASTASGKNREALAERLARLVRERLAIRA